MDSSPADGRTARRHRVAGGLAAATVLAQIGYPLLTGEPLRLATIGTVLLFAASSLTHAAVTFSPLAAVRVLVVAGGIGLVAEAVGVATGFPFGTYRYAGTLGPALLGVPLLVPLAWTMMAYPCLLAGRRLAQAVRTTPPERTARRPRAARVPAAVRAAVATAVLGGFALAAWDLYLDPQMVEAGHWTWRFPSPALPGVPGVPLTNYAGWLLVAVLMTAALDRALPHRPASPAVAHPEALPAALLAWTWLGSALGNAVFFGRPAVAVWGFVAMGATVAPYLWLVRRRAGATSSREALA